MLRFASRRTFTFFFFIFLFFNSFDSFIILRQNFTKYLDPIPFYTSPYCLHLFFTFPVDRVGKILDLYWLLLSITVGIGLLTSGFMLSLSGEKFMLSIFPKRYCIVKPVSLSL